MKYCFGWGPHSMRSRIKGGSVGKVEDPCCRRCCFLRFSIASVRLHILSLQWGVTPSLTTGMSTAFYQGITLRPRVCPATVLPLSPHHSDSYACPMVPCTLYSSTQTPRHSTVGQEQEGMRYCSSVTLVYLRDLEPFSVNGEYK